MSSNSESHLTPIEKLLTNLSLLKSQTPLKQPIVLLTTGSLNPIHRQHYDNFGIAKRELELRFPKIKVIAGYISPSQDLYVKSKLGNDAISIDERIEMCNLAVMESNWIDIDSWESKSSSLWFIDQYEVLHRLSKFLNGHDEINCNIKVFYLCGSDFFMKIIGYSLIKLKDHGIVIIGREKDDKWIKNCEKHLDLIFGKDSWKEFVVLLNGISNIDISSTVIRNKSSGWEELCDPNIVEYIKKRNMFRTSNRSNQIRF